MYMSNFLQHLQTFSHLYHTNISKLNHQVTRSKSSIYKTQSSLPTTLVQQISTTTTTTESNQPCPPLLSGCRSCGLCLCAMIPTDYFCPNCQERRCYGSPDLKDIKPLQLSVARRSGDQFLSEAFAAVSLTANTYNITPSSRPVHSPTSTSGESFFGIDAYSSTSDMPWNGPSRSLTDSPSIGEYFNTAD